MLVEAVPNFSEGRRTDVIDAIVAAAAGSAKILDVHSDVDHNRMVLTIAGNLGGVVEAAFNAAARAVALVDLRRHRGVHPRMGAVDVIPLVPLSGCTITDCADAARILGARIGSELGIPVYLYGAAAHPGRPTAVREIRGAGLDALLELGAARLPPDFGPAELDPVVGAVAVGARPPLVAFNAALDRDDLAAARRVARRVRASSGGLPGVQALGLALPSRGVAQVSTNLFDLEATALSALMGAIRQAAFVEGVAVAAWELVGLLPASALTGLEGDGVPGLPTIDDTIETRLSSPDRPRGGGATPG